MAGSFDFLHIKRHTAGSSNELSLDVLDHKSTEADVGRSRKMSGATGVRIPKSLQDNYHVAQGPATLSGQAEVEQRKRARRTHRIRLRFVAGAIILVALGVGVFFGVRIYNEQLDVAGRISALVERIDQVDEALVTIDSLADNPLDSDREEVRKEMSREIPQVTTELNKVLVDASTLLQTLPEGQEKIVVGQIVETAKARTAMAEIAFSMFELSAEVSDNAQKANKVWNDVLGANQIAREAGSLANKARTPDETSRSLEMTREAKQEFEASLGELLDISRGCGADVSTQEAYLKKRIESLDYAVQTSEALLAGNRDDAMAANDRYNSSDEEAARLAENLPPSLNSLVEEGYGRKLADLRRKYDAARSRTIEADSIIRENWSVLA